MGLDQSNARSSLSTQTRILIRQLACAKIRAKQESARALNKNQDLVGALRNGLKVLQGRLWWIKWKPDYLSRSGLDRISQCRYESEWGQSQSENSGLDCNPKTGFWVNQSKATVSWSNQG